MRNRKILIEKVGQIGNEKGWGYFVRMIGTKRLESNSNILNFEVIKADIGGNNLPTHYIVLENKRYMKSVSDSKCADKIARDKAYEVAECNAKNHHCEVVYPER